VLEAKNLKKSFGSLLAVADTSFVVRPGELVGLLGPNGAGKTTTISMLTGLTQPDSGAVLIDGKPLHGDTDPSKARIGVVPQELAIYEELSAAANLRFFGSLYGLHGERLIQAMDSALELVGLSAQRNTKVKEYSGGMQRRLNLAASLLHEPDILLLDEPTVGVDPQSRNAIFDNLEVLKQRGKTILYSSHLLDNVERLCAGVVVLHRGTIVAEGPVTQLRAMMQSSSSLEDVIAQLITTTDPEGTARDIADVAGLQS